MYYFFIDHGMKLLFALISFPFLLSCIFVVDQEHVRIVTMFGRFRSVRSAGLNFKAPWPFQGVTSNLSLKLTELAEEVGAKSADKAFVNVPIRVQYKINEDTANLAYYKLDDPEGQIRSFVVNRIRATAAEMSFDELFSSQARFQDDVLASLSEELAKYGYVITNVLVDDPQPSDELRKSFDRVLIAKRLEEAAEAEGSAARKLAVAKAEAEGEALAIKGKAYAEFRQTVAEGNAEAIKKFTSETGLVANDALNFFMNTNEMEAIRDAAANGGNVVFVSASAKDAGNNPALMGMMAQASGPKGAGLNTDAAPSAPKSGKPEDEAAA